MWQSIPPSTRALLNDSLGFQRRAYFCGYDAHARAYAVQLYVFHDSSAALFLPLLGRNNTCMYVFRSPPPGLSYLGCACLALFSAPMAFWRRLGLLKDRKSACYCLRRFVLTGSACFLTWYLAGVIRARSQLKIAPCPRLNEK